jgi:hypothetical protein
MSVTPPNPKPWQFLCTVIQGELGLDPGQVYVYENRYKIPPDHRLYVAIGIQNRRCISNANAPAANGAGLQQVQFSSWYASLMINLLSKSFEARDRAEEVVMALKSNAMQAGCELYAFRFGENPMSFANVPDLDGSAIPSRFVATTSVIYGVGKTSQIPYYDTFGAAEVTDEA